MLIRDLKSWFDERLRICMSLSLLFSCQQEGANSAFSKSNRIQTPGGGTTSTTESPSSTPSTSSSSTFSITSFSDRVFPVNALTQGNTLSLDWNNITTGTPGNDTGMTYSCVYDRVVDSAVNAGTSCSSLAGTSSFDTTTGAFSWTPDVTVWGSFELKVTGTSGSQSSTKYLAIAVRPNYVTSKLIGAWDAQFADSTQSVTGNYLSWKDLSGNNNHSSINNSTNASWSGSGSASSPYALNFNGSGSVDFGTTGSSSTKLMFSGWVNPSNTNSSSESVILGNSGNATGNGFTVRQKPSYRDVVLSLNPVGYWRLGETSGTTAVDLGSGGNNGTYTNGPTLAQAGGLTSEEDKAASFDGTNDYVNLGNNSALKFGSGNFTYSAWIKTSAAGANDMIVAESNNTTAERYIFKTTTNKASFNCRDSSGNMLSAIGTTSVNDGNWHFIVGVRSGNTGYIYVDGVLEATSTNGSVGSCDVAADVYIGGRYSGAGLEFSGTIDDVSIFNTALTSAQISSMYQASIFGSKVEFVVGKSYQAEVLSLNPYRYWKLDETSGTTATDYSGRGGHGTYMNGPTLNQTGVLGEASNSATSFDGTNDHVSITQISKADSSEYTLALWYRGTDTAQNTNFGKSLLGRDSTDLYAGLALRNGYAEFIHYNNAWLHNIKSTTLVADGNWHFIVYVNRSDKTGDLYIDGVAEVTGQSSVISDPTYPFRIDTIMRGYNNLYTSGTIDEVSIFNYALTSGQISSLYSTGTSSSGGFCRSTTGYFQGLWNNFSAMISGTSAQLFVNGLQECSVSVNNGYSTPASNLTAGRTASATKGWFGYLADLLLYGTSDGSAVATAANVKTNFDATADRYRQTSVGNIVTNGLVLNLDAANAKQGLRPFANGCASTDLNWFDLSSFALTGVLTSFASCVASCGWVGDGTTTVSGITGPFRMTFDGTNDYVNIGFGAIGPYLSGKSGQTIAGWIRYTSLDSGQYDNVIYTARVGAATNSNGWINIRGDGANAGKILLGGRSLAGDTFQEVTGTQTLSAGSWYYVAGTIDYANQSLTISVNGALVSTYSATFGSLTYAHSGTPTQPDTLSSSNFVATYPLQGDIAQLAVYSRVLSNSELQQNCNALKSRFSNATCN